MGPGHLAENNVGSVAGFPVQRGDLKTPILPRHSLNQRFCATSPEDFFKDSPWFNVPKDRLGEILIEPLHPRGGLLGGMSKQDGQPKSKLAALAAARKKKENQKPEESETITNSIALLDRLGGKSTGSMKTKASIPSVPSLDDRTAESATNVRRSKYPGRKASNRSTSPAKPPPKTTSVMGSPAPSMAVEEETRSAPVATPSDFAQAMFGSSWKATESDLHCSLSHVLQPFPNRTESTFVGPSPDDTILEAQHSKGKSQKPTKQALQPGKNNVPPKDITEGVNGISIEGQQTKGKNLDVLAEYKKSKPKNAANFVVIGMSVIKTYTFSI